MIFGISIEKIIKVIKNLKKTITEQQKTIMEQDEKIMQLYQDIADKHLQKDILEKIEEEKLKIEAQRKTEKEQKIDEILKITKKIEGYIDTQTIGSN